MNQTRRKKRARPPVTVHKKLAKRILSVRNEIEG